MAGTLGALTGGYRTTDLDGIGAYVVKDDPAPVLTNPVDTGVARAVVGGSENSPNNKHDATRTSYIVGAPVPDEAQQPEGWPNPSGTVTTRIGKGVNSTVDDGAVVWITGEDTTDAPAPTTRRRFTRTPRRA